MIATNLFYNECIFILQSTNVPNLGRPDENQLSLVSNLRPEGSPPTPRALRAPPGVGGSLGPPMSMISGPHPIDISIGPRGHSLLESHQLQGLATSSEDLRR